MHDASFPSQKNGGIYFTPVLIIYMLRAPMNLPIMSIAQEALQI